MTFQKVRTILKQALKEAEIEIIADSPDISDDELREALSMAKELILEEMGVDVQEFFEYEETLKEIGREKGRKKKEEFETKLSDLEERVISQIPEIPDAPEPIIKTEVVKEIVKEVTKEVHKPQIIETIERVIDNGRVDDLEEDVKADIFNLQSTVSNLSGELMKLSPLKDIDISDYKKLVSGEFADKLHKHYFPEPTTIVTGGNSSDVEQRLQAQIDSLDFADEKVKLSALDPTAGYLNDKLSASDGIAYNNGAFTNTDKGSDVDLSGYVPYISNVDLRVALGGIVDDTTTTLQVAPQTYTVNDPAGGSYNLIAGTLLPQSGTATYIFTIYAYREIDGSRVYSKNPIVINTGAISTETWEVPTTVCYGDEDCSLFGQCDLRAGSQAENKCIDISGGGPDYYYGVSIELNWTASSNADGYKVVLSDTNAGYTDNYYIDVATNSLVYDFYEQTLATAESPIVITPTTIYGKSIRTTGNIESTAFITTGGASTDFVKGDGSLDSSTYLTAETDPISLHLDQTTPQTVTGGQPTFSSGLVSGNATANFNLSSKVMGGATYPLISGTNSAGYKLSYMEGGLYLLATATQTPKLYFTDPSLGFTNYIISDSDSTSNNYGQMRIGARNKVNAELYSDIKIAGGGTQNGWIDFGEEALKNIDGINIVKGYYTTDWSEVYGLKIEDVDEIDTDNYAIKTGLGKVSFGDNVLIGTTDPTSYVLGGTPKINVYSENDATGVTSAIQGESLTTASGGLGIGVIANAKASGNEWATGVIGLYGGAYSTNTTGMDSLIGLYYEVQSVGSGSFVADMAGARIGMYADASDIGSLYGLDVSITKNSGTIESSIGINIGDMPAGTVSTYSIKTGIGPVLFGDKLAFTQTDGNEYIDSLADGFMDYGATTAHRFLANVKLTSDNRKLYFGTADDASIYYDGTNMIINPKVVGSGILDVAGVVQTDGYNSADGSAGITVTDTIVTDIRMNDGQLQKKTKTIIFKDGIRTDTGAESDWTDTTDI